MVKSKIKEDRRAWQKETCHTLVLSNLQVQFQSTSLQRKMNCKFSHKNLTWKCAFQGNNFGSFFNTMFILRESKTLLSCHLFSREIFSLVISLPFLSPSLKKKCAVTGTRL